jgi:ATP-dependent Clp protease protease subunit
MKPKPKENVIHILGAIEPSTLSIIPSIREAIKEAPDATLRLIISSPGGDEDVGFAIYDALALLPCAIITEGYGQICSIATLIFQAGHKRLLTRNCLYMMHNGSVELGNNCIQTDEISNLNKYMQRNNKRYYKTISQRTNLPIDKIKRWCDKEYYFTAKEAIKHKLADDIVRKF